MVLIKELINPDLNLFDPSFYSFYACIYPILQQFQQNPTLKPTIAEKLQIFMKTLKSLYTATLLKLMHTSRLKKLRTHV